MTGSGTDLDLLLALNSFLGSNDLHNKRLWEFLGNSSLIRGFPVFFSLLALWFSSDCIERRSRMLAGLAATSLAVVVSVWLQHHTTPHIRPLMDPALHLNIADPQWASTFGRQGSFPSDTATLFFSLAAVILLENRLVGCLCFVWVWVVIGGVRVAFGWHYPSDIAGSFILGPAVVYSFINVPYVVLLFERVLKLFENRMYIVHTLLFFYLADAFNLYQGAQKMVFSILK
ncbi:phosphatase PAP2 family protein [Bradyrhizobium tropiciagri]|uniref:phosphatase PAP2 family protein n=1 Tax=Bradyrhizobium tropiciagri TaxID=312253 RepID=UPI001BAB21AF|nr:phosphatase PAP2 family protein [Bradyrhizobium tropiciagri]MBR0872992.1 phosphatase PAP2 family protein [Bradyrhizobium tropiciagri]